jgi:hypothetical protein
LLRRDITALCSGVADATQCDQIGKLVRLDVILVLTRDISKAVERNKVMNIQMAPVVLLVFSAMLTALLVPCTSLASLLIPVGAAITVRSAFPSRAIRSRLPLLFALGGAKLMPRSFRLVWLTVKRSIAIDAVNQNAIPVVVIFGNELFGLPLCLAFQRAIFTCAPRTIYNDFSTHDALNVLGVLGARLLAIVGASRGTKTFTGRLALICQNLEGRTAKFAKLRSLGRSPLFPSLVRAETGAKFTCFMGIMKLTAAPATSEGVHATLLPRINPPFLSGQPVVGDTGDSERVANPFLAHTTIVPQAGEMR